jgi:tRNA A-37 threonylcarbamoyl transferase component Bud32
VTGLETGPRGRPAAVPSTARFTRRRRRPTGAPAPLPHHLGVTGGGWLIASVVLVIWTASATRATSLAGRATNRIDSKILRGIAGLRSEPLTDVAKAIDRAGSGLLVFATGIGIVLALMVLKRWRHLFTLVLSLVFLEVLGDIIYHVFHRTRPYDVELIGTWAGFSMPAPPVAVLTFLTVAVIYTMVVAGRPRTIAKAVGAVVVGVFIAAELYLANYHPFDVLVGVVLAVTIPLNAFRFFTPTESFPVAYRKGKTAHLDVTGRRGVAIREAISDQLGLTVVGIKPFGLAGSGGSTPLLITVEGEPDSFLFGKLYAMSHVRADRFYKLGRLVLYGRLEDERGYQSVRRLVQYEDYAARLLRDAGVPTAAPVGIVELTPEREYLFLTEFFDGAEEIGDATVDDDIIDQGLMIIRQLWDARLAHRDIKPANLLVRDGKVLLIDVAFVQTSASPWREAVDLANMMLVLAIRTDAERVYQRALRLFTEDDIAEAFAAARGIASPSQLRSVMKQDGRDLLAQFRAMAPDRQPISLQRWSVRRVGVTLALLLGALIAVQFTGGLFTPVRNPLVTGTMSCGTNSLTILMAQAVPTATAIPCVETLPAGWELGEVRIERGRGRFWLDSDVAGRKAVRVDLLPRDGCDVDGATPVPSDQVGTERYERPESLPPDLRSTRTYLLDGACITYTFDLDRDASAAAVIADTDAAIGLQPRDELVEAVERELGLTLCGAGAPPCRGAT